MNSMNTAKYQRFHTPEVRDTYGAYPKKIRNKLLLLRELIFQIAEQSDEIGRIEETLKWESPSYLTYKPRSGTTIRLSGVGSYSDKYAISVHCQTSLVSEFKEIYPALEYDGNRSIIFDVNTDLPFEAAKHFIYSALTYHHRKKHDIGI